MRMITVTTAGEFAQALENWIIDNKLNPKTPEEWNKCVEDLIASGVLTPIGTVEDEDFNKVKSTLKENFKVEEL